MKVKKYSQGASDILSNTTSLMGAGATVGGPIGAGIGAAVGLGLGVAGAVRQRRFEKEAQRKSQMRENYNTAQQQFSNIQDPVLMYAKKGVKNVKEKIPGLIEGGEIVFNKNNSMKYNTLDSKKKHEEIKGQGYLVGLEPGDYIISAKDGVRAMEAYNQNDLPTLNTLRNRQGEGTIKKYKNGSKGIKKYRYGTVNVTPPDELEAVRRRAIENAGRLNLEATKNWDPSGNILPNIESTDFNPFPEETADVYGQPNTSPQTQSPLSDFMGNKTVDEYFEPVPTTAPPAATSAPSAPLPPNATPAPTLSAPGLPTNVNLPGVNTSGPSKTNMPSNPNKIGAMDVAGGIMSAAPTLFNMAQALKKPEEVARFTYRPDKMRAQVNANQQLNAMRQQEAMANYNVGNMAGNSQVAAANKAQNRANYTQAYSSLYDKLYNLQQDVSNKNVAMSNEAQRVNNQMNERSDVADAQNRAASRSMLAEGMTGVSQLSQMGIKNRNQIRAMKSAAEIGAKQNQLNAALFLSSFPGAAERLAKAGVDINSL